MCRMRKMLGFNLSKTKDKVQHQSEGCSFLLWFVRPGRKSSSRHSAFGGVFAVKHQEEMMCPDMHHGFGWELR